MLDFVLQQNVLEAIVLIGIAIVIIGLFWRIIFIGGAALFCLVVLANHVPAVVVKPNVQLINPQKQEIITEFKVNDTLKYVDPRREEYIRDCVSYGFAKQWCKDNWDDKLEKE